MATGGAGQLAAGRFRLLELLGDGGMSTLWKARDERDGQLVALKIVPGGESEELRLRFQREARILQSFSHKNIVTVRDAGEIEGHQSFYLAMELLHGSPLSNHMHGEPMAPEDIVPVMIEVCRGLELAHSQGVVHRDLKPENIFLAIVPGEGVVPKVLDFGLSTTADARAESRITAEGQVLGTPMYMSPEQARAGEPVSAASDVWAMGVVLYEALTGMLPFQGNTVTAVLDAIVWGEPAPMSHAVDARARAVVARCLHKDPARRFPDAKALRVELERLVDACARARARGSEEAARASIPPPPARSLVDPHRVAAEPPTTRPGRLQRQGFRRAKSPLALALVAAAVCAAAIYAVPRPAPVIARARVGIAKVARVRVAAIARD